MNTSRQNFREWYTFFSWTLLLAITIATGLLLMEWTENKRFLENQHRFVIERLSTIRARLEGELNAELLLARSIITEVVTNRNIRKDRFVNIARHFMEASSHIRNIGLSKGTVLTFVYPTQGNEQAIGLDYTKIASQWPAVQRAIEEDKTVVAGPLNLLQGGLGIIGRTPIYVDTDEAGSNSRKFYGLLSVVINIPSLFNAAGLGNENSQLKLSIRGKDGLGSAGEIFYGSKDIFADNPESLEISLPGGSWQIASVPVNGWEKRSPRIVYYRIIAAAVGLSIFSLLLIQRHEMNNRRKAEEARKELIRKLQEALSEVKQLSGLLPICSNCKKVRDDKGYWNQIESYIQEHTDAEFSHSICKECAIKLYPDLNLYED